MADIAEISSRYVDEFSQLDPVRAVRLMGVVGSPASLTDYSPDGVSAMADLLARTSRQLRAASPTSEPERLGRLFLLGEVEAELALLDGGERERQVGILAEPPAAIRLSFDLIPRQTPDDWANVASRLRAVEIALDGYRETLRRGMATGLTASRLCSEALADQCAAFADGWFASYVASYGEGPLRAALDEAARSAGAAYETMAGWMRSDYLPVATEALGVGSERYRLWQQSMLGDELDLDETYSWGWEELARLEREQADECDRVIPGGSFAEVRDFLNRDPTRSIEGVDAYRAWLQEVTDDAIARLDGWQFDIPDTLKRCEIGIPPEGSAAAPYYTPPSEDLSTPGRTWFPTQGRTVFPTWDQVTTAYHEAVPGHHLQFGLTRLLPLTRAHKLGFQSAHGEGWALYAERLADEVGLFATPDTRLGFLSMQAFRAARVVIDIGLHTGRSLPDGGPWTARDVVDRLERLGIPTALAKSELVRYVSWPAQATCYKLGERAWLAGRASARSQQGSSFDLRRWHGAALSLGALGLRDLEHELILAGRPEHGSRLDRDN